MGMFFIYSIAGLLVTLQGTTAANHWEFGFDLPGSVQVFVDSGVEHIWEKIKVIHLEVPPCMDLIYVHVTVTNALATPDVTYNNDSRNVTIAYSLLQNSLSTFEVYGKAINIPFC